MGPISLIDAMYPRDWKLFLEQGADKEIAVAQVDDSVVNHLQATSEKVFIRHDYAQKAITQHDLRISDLVSIFDVVEYGRVLADKERHVTFMHLTNRGWFQLSVKCAQLSRRL